MAIPEFTVMMLGPEAVGKTTLLATMYKELNSMTNYTRFTFLADNDTGINLDSAYHKLSRIIEQPTFTSIKPLIEGTQGIINHRFEISFKDKKELNLTFCDIAGGLLTASSATHDFKEFQQRLNNSSVIINVLDGAAMVEGSDLFSDEMNRPSRVRDLLIPALKNENQKHLILFIITKCETWLNNPEGRSKIMKKFDERYQEVLGLIEKKSNVAGVLIPVKTLGCVEFSRMEKTEDGERIVFIRRANKQFAPEYTDQPLRYALAFVLAQRDKERSWWEKLFRWDSSFQEALLHFVKERDTNYKMYGNVQLINVV